MTRADKVGPTPGFGPYSSLTPIWRTERHVARHVVLSSTNKVTEHHAKRGAQLW
jgi:hypothetical protein